MTDFREKTLSWSEEVLGLGEAITRDLILRPKQILQGTGLVTQEH